MESISQLLGAFALVGVAAFELLQSRVNRITSEQVKDLQEQIDERLKSVVNVITSEIGYDLKLHIDELK